MSYFGSATPPRGFTPPVSQRHPGGIRPAPGHRSGEIESLRDKAKALRSLVAVATVVAVVLALSGCAEGPGTSNLAPDSLNGKLVSLSVESGTCPRGPGSVIRLMVSEDSLTIDAGTKAETFNYARTGSTTGTLAYELGTSIGPVIGGVMFTFTKGTSGTFEATEQSVLSGEACYVKGTFTIGPAPGQ